MLFSKLYFKRNRALAYSMRNSSIRFGLRRTAWIFHEENDCETVFREQVFLGRRLIKGLKRFWRKAHIFLKPNWKRQKHLNFLIFHKDYYIFMEILTKRMRKIGSIFLSLGESAIFRAAIPYGNRNCRSCLPRNLPHRQFMRNLRFSHRITLKIEIFCGFIIIVWETWSGTWSC